VKIELQLQVDSSLSLKYPGLRATTFSITGVIVRRSTPALGNLKRVVAEEIKSTYTLDTIKDVPMFRAYRDFFWRIGIDPTKVRPAAEALIRRILAGHSLPEINTLVDAYNLASIRTGVALAAFDQAKLREQLLMRQALAREQFLGIGMGEPMNLDGGEVVVADEEKLVAVYPYRDADSTKVDEATTDVVLMVCGCPGIDDEPLTRAEQVASELILQFCGGKRK
jgi:DNA/RNA-binding domain of Phe-tRNA-synthetase-like protein